MTTHYSLDAFFGSFFHQDWEEDYGSPAGALARFLDLAGPSRYDGLVDEIDSTLDRYRSDEQVVEWINGRLHAELYREAVGMPLRDWLLVVRGEVTARITASDLDGP